MGVDGKDIFQIIRRDVIIYKMDIVSDGRWEEVFSSVQACDYDIARGAQKLNLSVEEFEKKMVAAGYRVPKEDEVRIWWIILYYP